VNKSDFFEILRSLKETRKLSSESEAIIKPFHGKVFDLNFLFKEAVSTFANRLGNEFKNGKTVVAEIKDEDLDCSILFPKSENDWIDRLEAGEDWCTKVKVLEFDNLYQRVIFGFTDNEESKKENLLENSGDPISESSLVLHEKEAFEVSDEESASEDETEDHEKQENNPVFLDTENTQELDEIFSNDDQSETDSKELELDKIKVQGIKDEIDSPKPQKKEERPEEQIETPPPIPKIPDLQKKPTPLSTAPNIKKYDTNYLDKLRDKRYEHGEESLTEEEKETLANDIKINAASRQKELDKNTEKVNKGARFFFGFILMVFSLNSCNKGGGFFSFIIFCVGVYLTFPLLKKLKE